MKEEHTKQKNSAPHKLKLLVTVVNRNKAEFYADVLQEFEANIQLTMSAHGTARTEALRAAGVSDPEKAVIFSIIKEERAHEALVMLNNKFATVRNGKGIAFTVPLSSTIGVAVYRFLCNDR